MSIPAILNLIAISLMVSPLAITTRSYECSSEGRPDLARIDGSRRIWRKGRVAQNTQTPGQYEG